MNAIPAPVAFANALANQSAGHSSLLAVITPNLICKPATVMITKVTIKGAKQAVQMFGPAQAAVAGFTLEALHMTETVETAPACGYQIEQ